MAALTILRAYRVAGSPVTPPTEFGGFEEWSDWVRVSLKRMCCVALTAVGEAMEPESTQGARD